MKFFLRLLLIAIMIGAPVYAQAGSSILLKTLKFFEPCWFCGPFGTIFDTINSIITTMCSSLRPLFFFILGLFFLFWLLFRVGKVVLDITSAGDTQLVPDLFKQILRVMVASLLLTFYYEVFDRIITPVLDMALNIGNTIYLDQQSGKKVSAMRSGPAAAVSRTDTSLCPEYTQAKKQLTFDTKKQLYPDTLKQSFVCYIKIGHVAMTTGMAIGATAIQGWSNLSGLGKFRHPALLFIGIFLFGAFFWILLAFPTKLIDPLLTLTFVSALYPVWVVCWAFAGTRQHFDKARGMFIGVLVHLVVIALIARLAMEIMNSALGSKATQTRLINRLLNGEDTYTVFTTTRGFDLTGVAVLMTMALAWLAVKMFEKAVPLSNQFGQVFNFGINDKAQEFSTKITKGATAFTKNTVAAGAHLTRGAWKRAASRDDALGKVTRGLSSATVGAGVGLAALAAAPAILPAALPAVGAYLASAGAGGVAAAVARRFMPKPQKGTGKTPTPPPANTPPQIEESEDANHKWRTDRLTRKSMAHDKNTGLLENYDQINKTYQETDTRSGNQNTFDGRRNSGTFNGDAYTFTKDPRDNSITATLRGGTYITDQNNIITEAGTGIAVTDPALLQQIRDLNNFIQHVETRISEHEAKLGPPHP